MRKISPGELEKKKQLTGEKRGERKIAWEKKQKKRKKLDRSFKNKWKVGKVRSIYPFLLYGPEASPPCQEDPTSEEQ
jgi:hypothetical protein